MNSDADKTLVRSPAHRRGPRKEGKMKLYIPTGNSAHLEVEVDDLPEGGDLMWSPLVYEDGHREGIITFPNGERYAVEE